MFKKLLIANRGAIACRIFRTLREMDVSSVAVWSESDASSLHIREADESISLGEGSVSQTYLDINKILEAAIKSGVQAIHPGYGFLSENAAFAEACESRGISFIGPTPEQLRVFGLKHTARALAKSHNIPLLEGTELLADSDEALDAAYKIGFPVMLKSTAGGGGIGMRVCYEAFELKNAFETVQRLSKNNFNDGGIFVEKYIEKARHLEVQIFGDGKGNVISLGIRDCSIQRRNQKVIEETPAPNLPDSTAKALCKAAIILGKSVNYRSAGTVEFVYDSYNGQFYFLEVNTRLQVEHGVTEQVWGIDLVKMMIELASGDLPPLSDIESTLNPKGHAIQARVYAEDPAHQFQPSPGLLTEVIFPEQDGKQIRIDSWVESGCEISPFFDPMLAKIITYAENRQKTIELLSNTLKETYIYGVETNIIYLQQIIADKPFSTGNVWTRCLETLVYKVNTFEVLEAGTQTTVQDYPGRQGYWAVGVPPSGPMDSRSFQLGNRLLDNDIGDAGLEITAIGPVLKFNTESIVVITGANIEIELDGIPQEMNKTLFIQAGMTLSLGKIESNGIRSYLCIKGGINVPKYLGSKSTFTLGKFGGHSGRALRKGDVIHLKELRDKQVEKLLPISLNIDLPSVRKLRVIYGPHGSPEYFTPDWIETFFATDWEVHFNSSRTGIRLIGPKPEWARESGGEAGLHPSNIHDNPYAIGAVDFTGDMPVILGPDGPSLGGFVCPVTVIEADLWQLGQLKAGDKVRFIPTNLSCARELKQGQDKEIESLQPINVKWQTVPIGSPIVMDIGVNDKRLVARLSGDKNILLEIGQPELDLVLRFRGHALMLAIEKLALKSIIDLTPGIRTLQIHYQPELQPLNQLLKTIEDVWHNVCQSDDLQVSSRIVWLPLSWDDPACQKAIDKYMTTVRSDAPWCPSNLEFIRRINNLESIESVYKTVFEANYLVMGLGDVYLGAPVATPLDPRHRLVTTKYNPARTWTAENSVGIGGAYLCVYGMEGPGGYQFVGRTLQMWNRYHNIPQFDGKPWLLRFFDQIRFYPVSAQELLQIRKQFPLGRYPLKIEHTQLQLSEYQQFLNREEKEITAFRQHQKNAFNAEKERWDESEQQHLEHDNNIVDEEHEIILQMGQRAIDSSISGNLWQVKVSLGQQVKKGDELVILESMKMEIPLLAPFDGIIDKINVQPGSSVHVGQCVIIMREL